MKKSLTIFALLIVSFVTTQAQFDRKVRVGLKISPNIGWYQPSSKTIENKSMKFGYDFGLILDIPFSYNYAFGTGFEVLNTGGTIALNPDEKYYYEEENGISNNRFVVTQRKISVRYINLPLTIKMKTDPIRFTTYFAQFGVDAGFSIKTKTEDKGDFYNLTNSTKISSDVTLESKDFSKDANFLRMALRIGGGFEYKLTGSTSFMAGISYHNGFINAFKTPSKTLMKFDKSTEYMVQKANSHYVSLTLGILF